jgi:cleavage and polyadenylation specificity factor subunit 3
MSEPSEVTAMDGRMLPLKASVHYISFSAHSDFLQTAGFLDIIQPPYVVLVHGDANEMSRLKASLVNRCALYLFIYLLIFCLFIY